jgi:cytochrome b6-f complex iron-sulfur subunit
MIDRRTFLTWVSVGGLASSIPVVLAACQPKSEQPTSPISSPRPDGSVIVGKVADLDAQNFLQSQVAFAPDPILVVRDPNNADTLHAVNAKCTHKGCVVEWKTDGQEFVCPCHGSKFAVDGTVTNGPATTPLAIYPVTTEGTDIVVKPS